MTDLITFELKASSEKGLFRIVKRRSGTSGKWFAFGSKRYTWKCDADLNIDRIIEQFPNMYSKFIEPVKTKK